MSVHVFKYKFTDVTVCGVLIVLLLKVHPKKFHAFYGFHSTLKYGYNFSA